ncbi:hypothetical protein LTR05_008600 [Lithohypha guttulata]|uniref:Uncharacterized protein n=1 Tax=Lithohypha guttulata TaxID=1690604 RepID=A0AAN7SEP1_9EURO|nr:hypothetical protein LTR05_008600 [Lithohypha guttulata]
MSASVPPQSSYGGLPRSTKDPLSANDADTEDPSEIFESFRLALDNPCWKVLPAALRAYNIQADWRQYALYIVYEEKHLALFKDKDREEKKPTFMLRKLANGIGGNVSMTSAGGTAKLGGQARGDVGLQSSDGVGQYRLGFRLMKLELETLVPCSTVSTMSKAVSDVIYVVNVRAFDQVGPSLVKGLLDREAGVPPKL